MTIASTHRPDTNDEVSGAIAAAAAESSETGVMIGLDCGCGEYLLLGSANTLGAGFPTTLAEALKSLPADCAEHGATSISGAYAAPIVPVTVQ